MKLLSQAKNSHNKSRVSDDLNSKKPEGKEGVNSAEQTKRPGQTGVSSANAVSKKRNGKGILSSDVPTKQIAGTGAPSAKGDEVVFFKDVKLGPHEGELRFRLIHFWEARNALTKVLFGLEMLLIDEEVCSECLFSVFFFLGFGCSIREKN